MIDFTDVLTDPELGAVQLQRVRVDAPVGPRGRPVPVETSTNFIGCVTMDAGAILERLADGAYTRGSVLVTTAYPLRVEDIVAWRGARYTVANLDDYSQHGMLWAVCVPEGAAQ